MSIFYKFGRFWTVLCPVALLMLTFHYAHQLNSILNLDSLTDFYKYVFRLYLETGMRLGEGIKGVLDGNFLIIESSNSKTKKEKECINPYPKR